ncbi:MAG: RagB/SusD family nutrient uptake outer membrane protein [Bacteroidales bacterium]
MKNIRFLLVIFLFWFASCDVLEVEPQHSIPAEDAITSESDAIRALNGCYDALQSDGYYGMDYIAVGDLSADNLNWSGTSAAYNQMDNNAIISDNIYVEGIWSDIYTALNRINNLLSNLEALDENAIEENEKNEIRGELYFLRALAHFDLVKLFGGIPIRTSPITNDEASLNAPRNSVDVVYEAIWDDIEESEKVISSEIIVGRASMAALLALKARVHLYYYSITGDESDLTNAVESATSVIDDFGLGLEPDFQVLFNGSQNSESIFEIEFNEQDRSLMAQYFFPTDLSGRYEFSPTESIIENYDEEDERFGVSFEYNGEEPYVNRYSDLQTNTDNVYVFRLAEMYLIRAEANTFLEADPLIILADINAIRERANLLPFTLTNYDDLTLEIEQQRRLEFAFEGHRWFDLIRTNRAIELLEGVDHENQTLFPIPLSEILANDAIGNNDQNPGY